MNAKELFLEGGKSAGVWYCETCKSVRYTQEEAETCCTCGQCGKLLDRGRHMHPECQRIYDGIAEIRRTDNAQKLDSWDGWVYHEDYGNRGFCESLEELVAEARGDELPEFVFICTEQEFPRVTMDDITSRLEDEMAEDQCDQLKGTDELCAALEAFNEANVALVSYWVDYKRAVRVPQVPK